MLQKQVFSVAISEGLDTKSDSKLAPTGRSLSLENARFYKTGRLSKRFGFEPLTDTASDGLISDKAIRALASDDQEVNILTNEGIYSLKPSVDSWEKTSEISEVAKVNTKFQSKSALNHFNPDCDYNEEFNMVVTVHREVDQAEVLVLNPCFITVVLEDCETGIKTIKKLDGSLVTGYFSRQKVMLVNYNNEPRIIVFAQYATAQVKMWVLDKDLAILSNTTLETFISPVYFRYKIDVCRDANNIYMAIMYNTTIKVRKLSLDGAIVSTVTHTVTDGLNHNPSSDQGYGMSMCLSGDTVHIAWCTVANDLGIIGLAKSSLAVTVTQSYAAYAGISLSDVAICYDGASIILAVTHIDRVSSDTPKPSFVSCFIATWTTSYTIFYDATGTYRVSLLSRPFIFNTAPYVLVKCSEGDQTTGLVLNLSNRKFVTSFSPFALSISRSVVNGLTPEFYNTSNIGISGDKFYAGIEKSYAIDTNEVNSAAFIASIATALVTVNFEESPSTGSKVKLGETIYYTNGPTVSIDGRAPYESGFTLAPRISRAFSNVSGATNPDVAGKTFKYMAIYRFYNGKGEVERSIPSQPVSITTSATTTYVEIDVKNLPASFKYISGSQAPVVVLYRTVNNGTVFYEVSSKEMNPDADKSFLYDAASDTEIQNNAFIYTNGGVLESDSTPNAKFSTAGGNRMFLGGLEDDDEIAYTVKQLYGEAVSFSDFFRIRISSATSADRTKMAALGYLDGKLIIFRQKSVYFIAGDGPNLLGKDDTFTEPEIISSDTGCEDPRSVINIPSGLLFKSKKGIYLLDRSFQVSYVGAPVEDYNNERIVSAIVSDKFNEVRFYTDAGNTLTYNYYDNKWSVTKEQSIIDADIWNGSAIQVLSGKVVRELEGSFTDDSAFYSLKHTTTWLKMNLIQGALRIWRVLLIGDYKSPHTLVLRAYYDYNDTIYDEYEYVPDPASPLIQWRVHLKRQVCQAIKLEIFDKDQSGTGESYSLSNIQAEVGVKNGSAKLGASKTN